MKLSRYYTYSAFENVLDEVIQSNSDVPISKKVLGTSVENRSIYGLEIGTGSVKILAWSQMHGNESSTTRALIDLLKTNYLAAHLSKIKLYIIPVLNPDGAERWMRLNANGVDLNRDAIDQTQPESKILRSVFEDFQPNYCLNLHGQRTIYGNEEGSLPAQVSFLAPAGDEKKTLTTSRVQAMDLINHMVSGLKLDNAFIGRYSDDFNINCVGDYFTQQGVITVLFEAGHAGNDYSRDTVTGLMMQALKMCLSRISQVPILDREDEIINTYKSIPGIKKNFADVLIKNLPDHKGTRQDLSIKYLEEIKNGKLYFIPVITGLNDSSIENAHRLIDAHTYEHDEIDFQIDQYGVIATTTFEIASFCE